MAINLFSDYGGFYQSYKFTEIPKVDTATVKAQDDAKKLAEEALPSIPVVEEVKASEAIEPDTRTRTADLDNISLTFNTGDDFSYIGSEFEIERLDIAQAISDMRKDKILEDYQYFVGSGADSIQQGVPNQDGKVFLKL